MDKLLICLPLVLASLVPGCSREPKYVLLSKELFAKLDAGSITEISVVSRTGVKPETWTAIFTVTDRERIKVILDCIRNAKKQMTYLTDDIKPPFYTMLFKSGRIIYWGLIGWDDEVVYGCWGWWESGELLKHFKQWELDMSIPFTYYRNKMENPSPESDPNFPPNKLPSNRIPG